MATNTQPLIDPLEKIPADSPLAPYISVHPHYLSGQPRFKDCRIFISTLFDHVQHGSTIEEFLDGFPDVSRETATAVIELAERGLLDELDDVFKNARGNPVRVYRDGGK